MDSFQHRTRRSWTGHHVAARAGAELPSPMFGVVVKVAVGEGDEVAPGDLVVVLEAMKMEQPLRAHRAGRVSGLRVSVGTSVPAGAVICRIGE